MNGIRARADQVYQWLAEERPDVVCLQELKAVPDQIPGLLLELPDYTGVWHGAGPYSGVALRIRKGAFDSEPRFWHPPFDFETRAALVDVGGLTIASLYIPNGGKDFEAKMRFLAALEQWVGEAHAAGRKLVLCGDYNVARTDMDVHPKERKPGAIGQRPDEREQLERILALGLADVGREMDPTNESLFTWWAPWRNLRQRNIGWRLDYILVTRELFPRVTACVAYRERGTSDHAPVVMTLETG